MQIQNTLTLEILTIANHYEIFQAKKSKTGKLQKQLATDKDLD